MRYIKSSSSFKVYNKGNSGIADNFVTGISTEGNNVWIATANGLSVYNTRSNTWKSFRKRRGGLTDNYLTCVLADGNYVWIGTRTWGLNRYDKETNSFAKYGEIDGLNSNSITCLAKSGRYIWVGSEGGLNRYDIYSGEWGGYDRSQGLNLPKLLINAIVPEGNNVWVGTIAGVYKFDGNEEKFVKHSLQTVVFDIVSDGKFLWVASFDGIYRINKISQSYQLFTRNNGLIDNAISSIAMDSNYLWLGTETPGGGVMRVDKKLPQVEISGRTAYIKKNVINIYGSIADSSGIRSYSLSYRSLLIGGGWKTAGIRSTSGGKNIIDGIIGKWTIDPRKLNEETYEIRLVATSGRGMKNVFTYNIVIDKTDPKINLTSVPRAVSRTNFLLEGRFQEANMRSIWIKLGRRKVKAKIKLSGLGGIGTLGGGSFSQILNLRSGRNIIEIIAEDIGKHRVIKKIEINYDTAAPIITLENSVATTGQRIYKIIGTVKDANLSKIVLKQGNITLHPGGFQGFNIQKISSDTWRFIYNVTLNPGQNEYTFIAQDYSNKRGTATAKVTFKTDAPRIAFSSNIKTRVRTDTVIVTGTWSDNDLTMIEVANSTTNKKVKAEINRQKNTFRVEIKLKAGPNIISATAVDKEGNVTTITLQDPIKYVTEYTQQAQAVAINPGDSVEIRKIKEELNRLRQENVKLKQQIAALQRGQAPRSRGGVIIVRRGNGPRVPIPRGSQLYFVPYSVNRGDRLTKIAKTYLGSSRNYGEIAYFNDNTRSDIIKRRKSILVPTIGLLRMIYSDSRPTLIRKVADIIGESYNTIGPRQHPARYTAEIYNRFRRYMGNKVMREGNLIYTTKIAIFIGGYRGTQAQFIALLRSKNIKRGIYVIFGGNSVIYKKIIIR